MTNKLVVIINYFKVPKIKKVLLYEMIFLVPNYRCLQIRGLRPPDARSPCPLSSTEFVEPYSEKIAGYATALKSGKDAESSRPHTHSIIPKSSVLEFYCVQFGNNCSHNWTVLVTNLASGLLTLTDRPASFSVAQSLLGIHSRLQLQHKEAIVTTGTMLAR